MPRLLSAPRPLRAGLALAALAALALFPACTTTHMHATDFSGVPGIRGEPVEFQRTTSYALNGLFVFPLIGNAQRDKTIGRFTEEASGRGATRVDIQNTSSFTYWFIFPPISFFIHPVVTNVEGSVEGTQTALE